KCLRRWRDLLRVKIWIDGTDRLHGGRFAQLQYSRQRGLSRLGIHGIFTSQGTRSQQTAAAGGRGARGGGAGYSGTDEFYERDIIAAVGEAAVANTASL